MQADMKTQTKHPTLDHNAEIPVGLTYTPGKNSRMVIDLREFRRPDNLGGPDGHFQSGMRLVADGKQLTITPTYSRERNELVFEGVLPPVKKSLKLTLYGQPLMTYRPEDNKLRLDVTRTDARLTVDELRMLAISEVCQDHVPTNRKLYAGFDAKKHAPITDLHTHSSAQLSNKDLIRLGLKHNLDYPVELLQKLNITLTPEEQATVKIKGGLGARFSPLEHETPKLLCETQNEKCDVIPLTALNEAHLTLLQDQLQIAQDMTLSFTDFDRQYYRFVNPLVKNPALTHDMIMQIARDYQRNGVQYAELSTASMLNLNENDRAQWFKEMIAAVKEAEKETGVTLRFLIGVPRSYGPAKVQAELEKIKYAARHPLIAGVDLLGYESNRTSDFSAALSHIADWARAQEGPELSVNDGWDFKRDFTIRIHAGETGKNSGNVAEAVKIAKEFGVHVRIAHAINEKLDRDLDKEIHDLSSRVPPLVSMEFCLSSNLAYNNIKDTRKVPLTGRWLKCCQDFFFGSDGAGAIQTTPTQLALSALGAGVSLKQLEEMRGCEERFIRNAKEAFKQKTAAYTKLYGRDGQDPDTVFLDALAKEVKHVNGLIDPKTLDPIHPVLPARFANKMPILIAGASGESFELMDKKTQDEVRQAMHILVASVDPQKAYFVVGRSKSEGVTAALDSAIMEHNKTHPTNKFKVLALITDDTPDLPRSISWVVPQKGGRDSVPENLIAFMRGHLREGKIPGINIFIGGSNYTSDMILKCMHGDGLAYLLMENATGASEDAAAGRLPHHKFNNGKTLLNRISGLYERGVLNGEMPFGNAIDVRDDRQVDQLVASAKKTNLTQYSVSGGKGHSRA